MEAPQVEDSSLHNAQEIAAGAKLLDRRQAGSQRTFRPASAWLSSAHHRGRRLDTTVRGWDVPSQPAPHRPGSARTVPGCLRGCQPGVADPDRCRRTRTVVRVGLEGRRGYPCNRPEGSISCFSKGRASRSSSTSLSGARDQSLPGRSGSVDCGSIGGGEGCVSVFDAHRRPDG
jgi:hypothetical protein